jgi:hypothetical protein
LLLAGFALAASAPSAWAAKKKVGVSVNGMPAGPVRQAISDVVKKHGFEVVSPDLSSDSDDAIASAARQARLAAVVVGEVREGGKRLKLRVYGATGDLIGEGSWSEKGGVKKLAAAVERTLWARVGSALSKAQPASGGGKPAKPERQPEPEAEETPSRAAPRDTPVDDTPTYSRSKESDAPRETAEESEAPRKRKKKRAASSDDVEAVASKSDGGSEGPADTALDLSVGTRFVSRSLTWQQGGTALNPYSLGFAPALGVAAAWYPAAHATGGWASNVGLALSVEYVPGLSSQTSDGAKYPTSASDYSGGVRGRLVLGAVSGALTLGGGQQAVIFHSQGASNRANLSGTPDVKYTYMRAGLDLRIALPANLALMLGGGVRKVLSSGDQNYLLQAASFLPNASVLGFEATAAAGYRFLPMLEGRVAFDLRRYQITPGANALMTTGGADQYVAISVALAVLVDGSGQKARASSDDDEADAPPARPAKKVKESSESSDDEE